jgi:hypothetical protein
MIRILLLSVLIVLSVTGLFAQNNPYYVDNRGRDALLAPRIGIGAGVFTFFGDVNDNNYQHIFTSTYGVKAVASANLSRYFDVDLSVIYGNIAVNERSPERNFNFKSETFIGSAGISYNFNHLYKRPGIIQPFVGVGVAFINFDSKSDLFDANGNKYHYWSDGSIMNMDEDAPNAEQATSLQRDYVYETDLRDENQDGLGKYDQYTFSIPVSAGLDFKMGHRLSARLSTSFYYMFSDLMDDVSDKGEGVREGNSRNDMMLFSSVSVSYSIGVNRSYAKSAKSKYFEEIDFYSFAVEDSDGDGVNDFDDKCAQTPEGVQVDESGCPLDTDKDVIQDFRDDEGATPEGNVVTLRGVTLTDEMIAASYDSIAALRSKMHDTYPSGILNIKPSVSPADSAKLIETIVRLTTKMEAGTEYDKLFDKISDEVFSKSPEKASSVDEVFQSVDKAYKELVENQQLKDAKPLVITKTENISTTIPPELQSVDYNRDGLITSDEVLRVIEEVLDGTSRYSVNQIFNLIDYYQEYMEDAKAIDFGGTKAVYLNGKLHILENYKDDGLSNTQRFLANKYKDVDFNGDGKLTPDEVNRMISLFQQGKSSYSTDMINELIDLFFEE